MWNVGKSKDLFNHVMQSLIAVITKIDVSYSHPNDDDGETTRNLAASGETAESIEHLPQSAADQILFANSARFVSHLFETITNLFD